MPIVAQLIETHGDSIFQLTCLMDRGVDREIFLRRLASVTFPSLKHFAIQGRGESTTTKYELFREACPALMSVHFDGIYVPVHLQRLPRLTAVHMSCHHLLSRNDIQELRDALVQTSIIHLELNLKDAEMIWPPDIIFNLPTLQTFSMGLRGESAMLHITGFMVALHAPRMSVLAFTGDLRDPFDVLSPQIIGWRDKFPCLRTFGCPRFKNQALEALRLFAQAIPNLTVLRYYEENSLFTVLQETRGSSIAWPNLRTLSLSYPRDLCCSTSAAFVQLLKTRKAFGHPIEVLMLYSFHSRKFNEELISMVHFEPIRYDKEWPSSSSRSFEI
ncbi:hypothetical protein HWV62_38941 [Athelia sp. TMB]|nr:hypothetical protein HWV62_38941 [Athelia sp. TMB]